MTSARWLIVLVCVVLAAPTASAQIYRGPNTGDTAPTPTPNVTPEPEPEVPVAEEETEHHHLLRHEFGDILIEVPFSVAERLDLVGSFQLDRSGAQFEPDPALNSQLKVGFIFDTRDWISEGRLRLVYEHDLYTGVHTGGVEENEEFGINMPLTHHAEHELLNGYAQLTTGDDLNFWGGFQLNHWGMGLLANDGEHDWTPGSALFSDSRGADRLLGARAMVGPISDLGFAFGVGGFRIEHDERFYDEDDDGTLLTASIELGHDGPNGIGVYSETRRQFNRANQSELKTSVLDVAARLAIELEAVTISAELEALYQWGETSYASSETFPVHEISSEAASLRVGADFGNAGAVLDLLYASGDDRPEDDRFAAFVADPNYQLSLLTAPIVAAALSGRSAANGQNAILPTVAEEDYEWFTTGGGFSNTISIFPRGWVRLIDAIEIYGGPMFTFAATRPVDPLASDTGGLLVNVFGGSPSSNYFGTEISVFVITGRWLGWSSISRSRAVSSFLELPSRMLRGNCRAQWAADASSSSSSSRRPHPLSPQESRPLPAAPH
ncbi:MAG: hypothetical protein KC561_09850 [Myxococcales bacterium]|nr:hypothetical protein [Myxococcales bacterium]